MVANVAAVFTSLALLIATHDLVPFASALLFMALVCEVAAVRNHWLWVRPLLAAGADLGIWVLLYIYSGTEAARSEYKNVATPVLLALHARCS